MPKVCKDNKIAAYTLVELATVIVIIGLLVGGVLQGQELVKSAKVNAIIKEMTSYKAAMWTYYDKYNALPGDHSTATEYFGAADGNDGLGADCVDIASTSMLTCNGNGNGKIGGIPDPSEHNEKMRFWQHLSIAEVIKGTYTGTFTAKGYEPGVNAPRAAGGGGTTYEAHYQSGLYGKYGTFIKIAGVDSSSTTGLNYASLSPEEASMADRKADDGFSNKGFMMAIDSTNVAGCVTNGGVFSVNTVGEYILNSPNSNKPSCRFYMFMD